MRPVLARVFALVLLASTLPIASASGSTDAVEPPGPAAGFEAWTVKQMKAQGIPGVSIAVVENHRLRWARAYGLRNVANAKRMTTATPLQAASVSKSLAAVAAMKVFSASGLSIDARLDPLRVRLSAAEGGGRWALANPFARPVTARMLMSHTAGTNTFHYSGYREGREHIPTLRDELYGRRPATTPAIEVMRRPGVHWAYSSAGFTVLQAMIDDRAGAPFAEVMRRQILAPSGMGASTFTQPLPASISRRLAVPYISARTPLRGGARVFNTEASGGLTTTPSDLARFLIAFQRGLAGDASGPVPPAIARRMMVRQPGTTLARSCIPARKRRQACRNSWGLGFDVNLDSHFDHEPDDQPTGAWFGHSGFNSGYLTIMLGSKTGGDGVVVMANVAPEDMSGAVPQFPFMTKVVSRISEDNGWPRGPRALPDAEPESETRPLSG